MGFAWGQRWPLKEGLPSSWWGKGNDWVGTTWIVRRPRIAIVFFVEGTTGLLQNQNSFFFVQDGFCPAGTSVRLLKVES